MRINNECCYRAEQTFGQAQTKISRQLFWARDEHSVVLTICAQEQKIEKSLEKKRAHACPTDRRVFLMIDKHQFRAASWKLYNKYLRPQLPKFEETRTVPAFLESEATTTHRAASFEFGLRLFMCLNEGTMQSLQSKEGFCRRKKQRLRYMVCTLACPAQHTSPRSSTFVYLWSVIVISLYPAAARTCLSRELRFVDKRRNVSPGWPMNPPSHLPARCGPGHSWPVFPPAPEAPLTYLIKAWLTALGRYYYSYINRHKPYTLNSCCASCNFLSTDAAAHFNQSSYLRGTLNFQSKMSAMQAANRLRTAFTKGGPSFGLWQMIPGANVSRVLARSAGVDWVLVDCEHGNIDGRQF
ncbi:hypothetical protein CTA2_4362 [Colletotrichum tanaceti]|uniref:2-keto-3-deoxy-L-rhamnonate aldolase n=1 Tax=Colletotrichum tanaceti TaxID=1306861 RepID=A0A4U6X909_9PEZI|nr:hypothetical protein CTA2_4362 [Colletotrichum tanaceti]TKW52068.1 hypothetical protein CTA1_12240 [Colletotrichum tanaceti]